MTDEEQRGVISSITSIGHHALTSVPAGFLILCGINIIFVLGLLWFLNNQNSARERIIAQVVTQCLDRSK
jgi:hypothetical protein